MIEVTVQIVIEQSSNYMKRSVEEMLKQLDSLMRKAVEWQDTGAVYAYEKAKDVVRSVETTFHQELQKAREEERERIEAVFKEHVPPHAMDLEDSVWLKRLLNKAFGHD